MAVGQGVTDARIAAAPSGAWTVMVFSAWSPSSRWTFRTSGLKAPAPALSEPASIFGEKGWVSAAAQGAPFGPEVIAKEGDSAVTSGLPSSFSPCSAAHGTKEALAL